MGHSDRHCAACLYTGQKYKKKIHPDCQISVTAISEQTRLLVLYVINKAPRDPAARCGNARAEGFVLIFMQPLIDPLLVHSISQGSGCSPRHLTNKLPRQAVTGLVSHSGKEPEMW